MLMLQFAFPAKKWNFFIVFHYPWAALGQEGFQMEDDALGKFKALNSL